MRLSLFHCLLGAVLICGASLTGCADSNPETVNDAAPSEGAEPTATAEPGAETVNAICPIMGGKVTSEGGNTEWKGQKIGFCCPGCESEWDALSDSEKSAKLAEAGEQA